MTNPYSTDPTSDPTGGSGGSSGDAPADPPIYLDPDTHQQLFMDPVTGEFRYDPAAGTQPPPGAGTPPTPMGLPQYPAPQYPAPQYPAPQYPAQQYSAPQYPAQQYSAPQYPAQQYSAPQYPYAPYPASYGYPPPRATSNLAVASMVTSIVGAATLFCWGLGAIVGLVGAILGHVARRKIGHSGEGGAGMALAGIIVGWIVLALGIAGAILVAVALSGT